MQDDRRRTSRAGRKRLGARSLVASGVAIAAVVVGVAVLLLASGRSHPSRGPGRHAVEALPPCTRPTAVGTTSVPTRLGTWPFHLLVSGTFSALTAAPDGDLVALQACGADESSLRLLELNPSTDTAAASARFAHVAPVASAIAATGNWLWFAMSRLALHGGTDEPPYRLSLARLDPSNMRVEQTVSLGRGYGLTLAENGGSLLVSTGRQLLQVDGHGSVRAVASFPKAVAQQLAPVAGSERAIVSLFDPTAIPPRSSTSLALVDTSTGSLVSSHSLGAGQEVEAVEAGPGRVTVTVSAGGSSQVRAYGANDLRPLTPPHHGVATTLTRLSLGDGPSHVFVYGSTTLACTSARSGEVLASTTPRTAAQSVTSLVQDRSGTYALTPAGIGRVTAPDRCAG